MALLLLSLGVGAVPDFITTHVNRPANEIRVGYLNDAAGPFAGGAVPGSVYPDGFAAASFAVKSPAC